MARRPNRLSLDQLRVLDAIGRRGSFAAAAQELCVVTSSVTHTVRNLEEDLGLTLFDRSGRSARFTSEGRRLLEMGRHLLQQAGEFDQAVQLLATGWERSLVLVLDHVIRLDALSPLFTAFFAEAPHTSLDVRREAVAGSWDALLSGRADLVIGAPGDGPPGGGHESVTLGRIRFVFAVAPGHALARAKGVVPEAELARHRAVMVGDTTRHLPRLPRGLLDSRDVLMVPDAAAKLQAILDGICCGFLPERMARPHLKAGRLVALKVEAAPPPGVSTLAWRAGEKGRALTWWIERLTRPKVAAGLLFD
jgi:DNA-binding transcriptional LysR family regulator